MRFYSVRFRNFKLLRDVELKFSIDPDRPLTVIRAANASGKTSTLTGLRWALYGNRGLEDPKIRLSPMDWPADSSCDVSVELDFEHAIHNRIGDDWVSAITKYRLIRRAVEHIGDDGSFTRDPDEVHLFELSDKGAEPLENPDLRILEMLPVELEDVFFTDGDAAMSFISPQLSRGNRRDQVKGAVKSLLGLGLLQSALEHVARVRSKLTRSVGQKSGSSELADIAKRLEDGIEELAKHRADITDIDQQIEQLGHKHAEADRQLQVVLQEANYDELVKRRKNAESRKKSAKNAIHNYKGDHRKILESEALSWALISETLLGGFAELASLHDAGIIPKTAVPILEDRLALGICICGADLSEGTHERHAVVDLIRDQKSVDAERERLTQLFHVSRSSIADFEADAYEWPLDYRTIARNRLEMNKVYEEALLEEKYCEERIRDISHADIEEKRRHRDSLASALREKESNKQTIQIAAARVEGDVKKWDIRFKELTRLDKTLKSLNARMTATTDIERVLRETFDEISSVYVKRVSDRMNELFLDMVGADPDGDGIISGASISPDYDIVVHSGDDRVLHPDHELNGASKRALTFAFIWALTEVSGAIAPRVIDTPLGMMSGPVKRRVLDLVSRPSHDDSPELQVILFLTRSEIAQTEDLLDERAGVIETLTNSDHYPRDLVNDPSPGVSEVIVCDCDHRHACEVCRRSDDDQFALASRSA